MSDKYGNHYALEVLDNGVVSFRHLQTGEILHGSVGPEKEAKELYIGASGLQHWTASKAVIFDIGTGCAAQLLALLDHLQESPHLRELEVFSFDLEKHGLRAALDARSTFAAVERHHQFLQAALESDRLKWPMSNEKTFNWHFIGGDFRTTLEDLRSNQSGLSADFIFYDFFSPASHPWLWTYSLFKSLYACCNEQTRLVTYSSATCVKAALAAAGWFVGTTIASGKKASSIIAASRLELLAHPLPEKFLSTFLASHKPYCDAETDESKSAIHLRMSLHPQFCSAK